MKKYIVMMCMLMLAACGGGHGGGYNSDEVVSAVSIPQQRISANIRENNGVTGMDSSVNNAGEMTVAVENALGTDLLTEISKDLDAMANSIRRYSNRELSDRRNASSGDLQNINASTKTQTAYAFLEYARRFRGFDANNRRAFVQNHPEHRNFILGWGKLFCGCDLNGFSDEQLLSVFDNSANQARFDAFYNQNHYKEFLLDDVRFNVAGFSNGEPETDELKFVVNRDNGVITGLEVLDDEDNVVEVMNRDQNADGTYKDTFNSVGYKYQISINNGPYFVSDSFTNKNIRKQDLRDIIENMLSHDDGYTESDKTALMNAFDSNQGRWVEQVSSISYDLKGNSLGLRYSDFGYSTMVTYKFDNNIIPEDDRDTDNMVIVGGFKSKQIDPQLFANQTMDFRGTAIGAAAYYPGNVVGQSKKISTDENAATLHFANGNETLIMPFNDYYTVRVDKDANGATVTFYDYPATSDVNFKFTKESNISTSDDLVNTKINYYGDNYVPSEVVGGVAYEEHSGGALKSFESAFGMKRQ